MDYAELHCRSNFSFLDGASHPEELVERAARLGYAALALTDECSVAGVVRAHEEHRRQRDLGQPLRLVLGSEVRLDPDDDLPEGARLVLLVRDRDGWAALCALITTGRGRTPKGRYRLGATDLRDGLPGCFAVLIPARDTGTDALPRLQAQARWLARTFGDRGRLGVTLLQRAEDTLLAERTAAVAAAQGLTVLACGDVHMHRRSRKPLQDTLTALRHHRTLADCGDVLAPNAEQHLRDRLTLARLYRPAWCAAAVALAAQCTFRLDELRYEYPDEIVPAGHTATSHLRAQTLAGLARRYHARETPAAVRAQAERELALIAELRYEAFFLTVHDLVRFARSRGILCQGRGSAANSVVCYALGITEVDPACGTLLFERFISRERGEPPDIDVDFEHERREEVIQYLYARYGRHRTALAAAVSTYRMRGAVRDIGKALGVEVDRIDAVARAWQWFDTPQALATRLREQGLDPDEARLAHWRELTLTLLSFPRHLSQHSGGFVIARDRLTRLVPIEPTAMPDRQVIQWDKDDLESLGLLKVDVLALGMLTVLRKALALHGRGWTLHDIPREDPATYAMIARADTVGTFQIESRAQQAMLPRLRPACYYDLVVQVAIVRPGPIQGGMVHPYLQRRRLQARGRLPPSPFPDLDAALARTLGVPIFQEQVMQVCMIAAGFSAGEADHLRRAMAAWRRRGGVHHFHDRVIDGMTARGYPRDFAEGIFRQILGFGDYGFPESHAAGFAMLAYFSAWLKCHAPEAFLAALLNAQPMGFYAPAQLVQDARRHGVEVRPVDVNHSEPDCTLEPRGADRPAVRLGLRLIHGLAPATAERLVARRRQRGQPWSDVATLADEAGLDAAALQALARADALAALAGHRRQQMWAAATPRAGHQGDLLAHAPIIEPPLALPAAGEGEAIRIDYAATGLTLRRHPLALLRPRLQRRRVCRADALAAMPDGRRVRACGLVTARQQPPTAHGTVFVTIEDESGPISVIVPQALRDTRRAVLVGARLLAVEGRWQKRDSVGHLIAQRLADLSDWLGGLDTASRDFR